MTSFLKNITARELTKQYASSEGKSLDLAQLNIQPSKITGILGPNGAGKTTLISIMCGLLDPTTGSVKFELEDGSILEGKKLKGRIGFVPQDFAFYDELSPKQNLDYFGAMYDLDRSQIAERSYELLTTFGLSEVANKRIRTFSGGMKRRVNLALGIIHRPEILFLDEPTVGVDVQSRMTILKYLVSLKDEGTTIIYSSHHLNEAQELCDDLVLIDHGKVIEQGSPDAILSRSQADRLETVFLELTGEELRD